MTDKTAPGEMDLDALIRTMRPTLASETYVFATTTEALDLVALKPMMQFQESEGLTLIVEQERAVAAGIAFEFPCKMITLNVHSSLDAVGFLARITSRLAELGMGVNPVSGFYHDHLFIPADRAEDAMDALRSMSAQP